MGRASIQGIDALVLVVEPGSRSIETANNMGKMARDLGIKCVGVIANKITEKSQIDTIKSQLKNITILGNLGYSRSLQQADLKRAAVFDSDTNVTEELKKAKNKLVQLVSSSENDD
jgi:CO dehydrogenase maturation factor